MTTEQETTEEIEAEVVVTADGEVVEVFDIVEGADNSSVDDDDYDDEDFGPVVESPYDRPGRWYVVHTYSGYENKVKGNLENVIASRAMEDSVYEIVIPMEDVV